MTTTYRDIRFNTYSNASIGDLLELALFLHNAMTHISSDLMHDPAWIILRQKRNEIITKILEYSL